MIPSDFLIVLLDNEHWYTKSCKEAPDYNKIQDINFKNEKTFFVDDNSQVDYKDLDNKKQQKTEKY